MQCALDINRYFSHNCSGEGRIGKGHQWSGGREGIGKRAKRVNESKVTPGEGRRDSGQEGDTRRAFVCFVCSVVLVVVVAISNCQLSMNLQKYKQTDRQGQAQGRRVRSAVQLKRLTASSARRSCPEIARLLACLPACLVLPYASSVSGQGTSDCTLGLELPMLPAWLRPELCKSNGTYRCQLQYYCCNSAVCQAKQSIETGKGRRERGKGLRSLNRLWALPTCG